MGVSDHAAWPRVFAVNLWRCARPDSRSISQTRAELRVHPRIRAHGPSRLSRGQTELRDARISHASIGAKQSPAKRCGNSSRRSSRVRSLRARRHDRRSAVALGLSGDQRFDTSINHASSSFTSSSATPSSRKSWRSAPSTRSCARRALMRAAATVSPSC